MDPIENDLYEKTYLANQEHMRDTQVCIHHLFKNCAHHQHCLRVHIPPREMPFNDCKNCCFQFCLNFEPGCERGKSNCRFSHHKECREKTQ